MHRTLLILALVLGSLIGGGAILIDSNSSIRSAAQSIGLITPPVPAPLPLSYNAVYLIGDPSGSGSRTYSVPRITIEYLDQIISAIQEVGSGDLWLSFIDKDAANNIVLHLSIPGTVHNVVRPERRTGERKASYDRRLAEFRSDSIYFVEQREQALARWEEVKKKFLAECQRLIDASYQPKPREDDYSDVIGSLNAAGRSLGTVAYDSLHYRSIILASDGEQTWHPKTPIHQLIDLPIDIATIMVNHSGSRKSVLAGKATEVDNLDRALMHALRIYEPSNKSIR